MKYELSSESRISSLLKILVIQKKDLTLSPTLPFRFERALPYFTTLRFFRGNFFKRKLIFHLETPTTHGKCRVFSPKTMVVTTTKNKGNVGVFVAPIFAAAKKHFLCSGRSVPHWLPLRCGVIDSYGAMKRQELRLNMITCLGDLRFFTRNRRVSPKKCHVSPPRNI